MGGTYDRYLEGESAVSKPESQLYIPADVSSNYPSLPCRQSLIANMISQNPCCESEVYATPAGYLPWQLQAGGLRDDRFLGHCVLCKPVWRAAGPGQREVQPGNGLCIPSICARMLSVRNVWAEPHLLMVTLYRVSYNAYLICEHVDLEAWQID